MAGAAHRDLMRERGEGRQRVTNIELFFDLVYVFAITQLSHCLPARAAVRIEPAPRGDHRGIRGGLRRERCAAVGVLRP
jgi:hypothetical protein